jgi:transposase-like protein
MAARSVVAAHILQRLDRARRLDPTLTVKAAARELGISTSSIYKMRAGTRSGMGSIAKRVMGHPGAVTNEFTVTYKSGGRVGSQNVAVVGARTRADAMLIRHDPKTRRALKKQLSASERKTRSHYWKLKEISRLEVTGVAQPVAPRAGSVYLRGIRDFEVHKA